MKFFFKILIIVLSFQASISCKITSDHKIIRLAHGLNEKHSVHKAMLKMQEDLKKISGGKLILKIYPNQQLGSERECLELLQIGSLDMTKVSVGTMENFAPKMKVFGLPFLFKNKEHVFKVLDSPIGKKLLNEGQKYWLKGLCYYDAGSRSFYTREIPIKTPKDLKGMKIRVMESATSMSMVKSLGGSPTPISWGELYTSLQQNVVDGAENNPPSFYLSKHYEVCKYYSLDEHTVLPDIVVANTHFWNRLTPQEQKWIQEAIDKSVKYQRKLWAESERQAINAVKREGVEIIYPDKELFKKEVQDVYNEYKGNQEMQELINRIVKTK